jgi:iron(III) transport system permease protein
MSRRLLRGFLLIALFVLVVNPLVLTLADTEASALAATLSSRRFLGALGTTLWISIASTVLAALVGVPLALAFDRVEIPGRPWLAKLLALPIALPPLVGVLTFLFLWGESGFAARAAIAVFGLDGSPWRLQGTIAILLVHTYSMYVYFYLFVRAALERRDPALEEAAAALGAGPWRVLARVTLPLLRPALAGAAVLTFMTALGSFSAPYFFGGPVRVLTTQIFNAKLNGDVAAAQAQTVALAAIAILALLATRRAQGAGSADVATARAGGRLGASRRLRPTGTKRWLWTAAAWAIALFFLLPHATLLVLSFVPAGTWNAEALPPQWSTVNYGLVFGDAEHLRPMVNSLWMAAVATLGAAGLALLVGMASRGRGRMDGLLRLLTGLPWAVPGTVLAVAIAVAFSAQKPWFGQLLLVGTPAILPLAYLIRSLPSLGESVFAGLRQLDRSQEEAAAALGAGSFRRLLRIVIPALRPALVAGGVLAFLAAAGDFVLSIVLYTYETRPISLEILSSMRLQQLGVAATYGVVLSIASIAAFWSFGEEKS